MTEHWNDFLEHKSGHKYIKRWWKNGRWNYEYPEDKKIADSIENANEVARIEFRKARQAIESFKEGSEVAQKAAQYAEARARSRRLRDPSIKPGDDRDWVLYFDDYKKTKKRILNQRKNLGKIASLSRIAGRAQQLQTTYDPRRNFKDLSDSTSPKTLLIKSSAAVRRAAKKGKKWISSLFS